MTAVVMTLPRNSQSGGTRPGGDRRPRTREPLVLFGAATAVYLLAGWWLIHFNIVFPDALSRVANAFYVLYSRDPHLAAIGFVWNPLPSILLLPILPLKFLFPGLVVYGAAGVIQSALSMAGTVVVLSSCLRKLGVRGNPRLVLVAIFALQPMIVLYGGSGQSEPMFLLFLMLTASALISWMQHQEPGSLVAAGIALGFAYLTRYEAGAAAVAVTTLVVAVTALGGSGRWSDRLRLAINDAALVAAPFLFAFFLWGASAKVLVGQWFPTFVSQYGNRAQVSESARWIEYVTGTGVGEVLAYLGSQTVALAPLFGLLLGITAVLALRRRDPVPLVLVAVFGSVMAFLGLAVLLGAAFYWLRFQIAIVPLTALLAGAVIGMLSRQPTGRRLRPIDLRPGRSRRSIIAAAGVLVAVAMAIPVQARVLLDPARDLAREEAPMLSGLIDPDQPGSDPSLLQRYVAERDIAAWLDRRDPGRGTVLVDSAYGYAIIISSAEPETFVITSDRDFQSSVEDPRANGIKYILVQSERPPDAVQVRWPTMFADGAGLGSLQRRWVGTQGQWRLYALT